MALKAAGIPTREAFEPTVMFDPADITALMRLAPGDDNEGWRVIATYPSPGGSRDKRYRAAHARSQHIRAGRVRYLADLGEWDAQAVLKGGNTLLYLRYLGTDGNRWEVSDEAADRTAQVG